MEVDRVGWDAGRAGSGQHRVLPSVLLRCSTPILEITRRHFLQLGKLRFYLESARSIDKGQAMVGHKNHTTWDPLFNCALNMGSY